MKWKKREKKNTRLFWRPKFHAIFYHVICRYNFQFGERGYMRTGRHTIHSFFGSFIQLNFDFALRTTYVLFFLVPLFGLRLRDTDTRLSHYTHAYNPNAIKSLQVWCGQTVSTCKCRHIQPQITFLLHRMWEFMTRRHSHNLHRAFLKEEKVPAFFFYHTNRKLSGDVLGVILTNFVVSWFHT